MENRLQNLIQLPEYQAMPFTLSNVPANFQDFINKILAEKLDVFVIIYLNNILNYTENVG